MKVQKSVSHGLRGKEYVKHQIVIPNGIMVRLGWAQGDQLEARISLKGLLLYKIASEPKTRKLGYEEFKGVVIKVLSGSPNGRLWSEIRQLASLHQRTPSPIWVKKLEDENILFRTKDSATSQVIWSLNERVSSQIRGSLNGWIA